MNVIFTKRFEVQNKQKTIQLINDNFANAEGRYDLMVCSTFKGDYLPIPRTVIGALDGLGISVKALSQTPKIDCKNLGAWISEETGHEQFARICCVELIDSRFDEEQAIDVILKQSFSTLKYVIEQAAIKGLSPKRILLPILGGGDQHIELSYIIPPLVNQAMAILNFDEVEEITFFELNEAKANHLCKYLTEALNDKHETDVFISYSSKQSARAYEFAKLLQEHQVSYWMAPESIPPSGDYLDEIPNALTNTKIVLLLLTPESEASVWVAKEVATAMGANKIVIPCQLMPFDISQKFRFLLDGCQILPCFSLADDAEKLIEIINSKR